MEHAVLLSAHCEGERTSVKARTRGVQLPQGCFPMPDAEPEADKAGTFMAPLLRKEHTSAPPEASCNDIGSLNWPPRILRRPTTRLPSRRVTRMSN